MGGEHEESAFERICLPGRGHVIFSHSLEESPARLGRRAVDIFWEENMREDRAPVEKHREGCPVFLEHISAREISAHEISGEKETCDETQVG